MKKLLIVVSALLLLYSHSSSQNKFAVNLYGGYTMPAADIQGDFPDSLINSALLDFTKSKTLLTKSGYGFGIQGKYAVDSTGKQRLTAGVVFNTFSGTKDYPMPSGTGSFTYKNKVSIFTVSAGIEYAFSPAKKFSPYLGLDVAANFYSGKIETTGDTTVIQNRKSESRFGVIASGGAEFKLSKSTAVIVGVKYSLTNLIGKSSEITTTTGQINDIGSQTSTTGSEVPLNDKATTTTPEKSLNYVQFFAGVTFYFGEKLGKK